MALILPLTTAATEPHRDLPDRADKDIENYYTSRLPGEPAAAIDGARFHPAEPRRLRASLAWHWQAARKESASQFEASATACSKNA